MTKEELRQQIEELMQQYGDEEIDAATYEQRMMDLTTRARNDNED